MIRTTPTGWRRVKLGEICNTFAGGTPARTNQAYFGGTIPWIKSGELNAGDIWATEESLTVAGVQNSATRIVEPGTNLIALYGATAGVVGRTRIRAAINQAILAVVPSDDSLAPDFLEFLLQLVGSEAAKLVQGGQPNLNSGLVQGQIFDLPPKNEQLVIAAMLKTWRDAIRIEGQLIARTLEIKRGLMQQLLTGETRFKEFKGRPWRRVRIGSVLEERDRYVEWEDERAYRFASVRRRSGGLFDRGIFFGRDVKTKVLKLVKEGDFLISKRQVVHGAWGMVTRAFDGFGVSDEYDVLVGRDPTVLDIRFFNYLSQTRRMYHLAFLAANGVHIEKLIFNFDDFAKEQIKIPPTVDEQAKIVHMLSVCDREIELLQKQLDALKEQKRGLMQKLLTGQIRVKVPKETK